MKTKILDLIDFEKVNTLLEGFNQSTGFVTAILDLEGNILSKSGWRKICTQYHRVNSETSKRCTISDTLLAGRMARGEKYHFYKCLNGLVDVAVPIIIKGEHIANLFSGQFFFEKPDQGYFLQQASKFGFDETFYMKALSEVPVISEEKVKTIMEFLLDMTYLISEMTFQRMELMDLNQAIQISEERYRLVLETSMDALLLVAPDGSVLSANQAACTMFQQTENEILGLSSLIDPNDPRWHLMLEEIAHSRKAKGELWMCRKNKVRFPAEVSTSVFTDQKGDLLTSMIIRDITDQKATEEQLIIAKEKAEESDRLKTAFLQNMSHEIRTPMNAIMGFSDLLKEQYNNQEKLDQYADIINQRCNDLLDVINDILDIAKIESGQLHVNIEPCNINDLFGELSGFFPGYQNRIGKEHIKLNIRYFSETVFLNIHTDKVKLKQIFINLISNAFKFTESGYIEVGCKLNEEHHPVFYVSDTGIGIPKEKQNLIFERFTQLNQNPRKNIGGTGLGLSIVKGLVQLLGGDISLDSKPGKGSTFTFSVSSHTSVPKSPEIAKPARTEIKDVSDKTILVVDDDIYNCAYLKEVLSGIGSHVIEAETGESAIDQALHQSVDLVLMDIRLPGMDGYEATRQILNLKPQLKIIAQTAYASSDERKKALKAGCRDYISKPTKKDLILLMIYKYLD